MLLSIALLTIALGPTTGNSNTNSGIQIDPIPPPNHARSDTSYDWCDCRHGRSHITIWETDGLSRPNSTIEVHASQSTTITFAKSITQISWICDGMVDAKSTTMGQPAKVWSVRLTVKKKSDAMGTCNALSGRIKWNQFQKTNGTSIPFSSYTDGYACMKIPTLLRTLSGTLLATAEARTPDCGDFSRTDLVYKRSKDNGTTWSKLHKLVNASQSSSGLCGNPLVIGNAAPVQLALDSPYYPGRILVPHMRNNYEVWITHSDDDGATWSPARYIPGMVETFGTRPDCKRNMTYFGLKTPSSFLEWVEELGWSNSSNNPFKRWSKYLSGPWQFVGLGPPGSIQLREPTWRIIVPGYHSYIRGLSGGGGQGAGIALPVSQLYNNFALGHVVYSDDGGDTWELGSKEGFGGGAANGSLGANEDQLVQLKNGSLLLNSRSLATGSPQNRVQAISNDFGLTFTQTRLVKDLPEPFNGCQGSVIAKTRPIHTLNASKRADSVNSTITLFLSHPNPMENKAIAPEILKLFGANINLTGRDHMTIWKSNDEGGTYVVDRLVDPGAAGYSSLQAAPQGEGLFLLYEQSDRQASSLKHLAADALIGALSVLNPDRFVFRWLEGE